MGSFETLAETVLSDVDGMAFMGVEPSPAEKNLIRKLHRSPKWKQAREEYEAAIKAYRKFEHGPKGRLLWTWRALKALVNMGIADDDDRAELAKLKAGREQEINEVVDTNHKMTSELKRMAAALTMLGDDTAFFSEIQ